MNPKERLHEKNLNASHRWLVAVSQQRHGSR
jgi:hypothetical protein